jgi:hypothetical protein
MTKINVAVNWFNNDLVIVKKGKVVWTRNTKHLIPARIRNTLMNIRNGTPCPGHLIGQLKRYGFDSKGYYHEQD